MIKLIVGAPGTGKTRKLTELANEDVKKTKGHLIYIDHGGKRMLQVDYKIRYINISEYEISDQQSFYSFICGVIASNYDIETIYIDGLYKTINVDIKDLDEFFKKLDNLEMKYNINFAITLSSNKEDLPEYLRKYSIQ